MLNLGAAFCVESGQQLVILEFQHKVCSRKTNLCMLKG